MIWLCSIAADRQPKNSLAVDVSIRYDDERIGHGQLRQQRLQAKGTFMDIFDFAMEKEKYAEYYYRDLAERTGSEGLKQILTMLAGEEAKHYQVVEQMKTETPSQVTETNVLASAAKVFEKMRGAAETFQFDVSEADLYRKARDIEKESKKYYLEKADEVTDPGQKTIFKRLAEEENKHQLLIERIGDFVAKPETFLEDAEMYHFDDYVEGQF